MYAFLGRLGVQSKEEFFHCEVVSMIAFTRWFSALLVVVLLPVSASAQTPSGRDVGAGATVTGLGAEPEAAGPRVAVVARGVQPGEVVRVDVTCPCGTTLPRVSFRGSDIPLFPVSSEGTTMWQGLVGLDLDTAPGVYPLAVHDVEQYGPPPTVDLHLVAKAFATRRLRVAPAFVDPPAAEVERLLREAKVLEALFASVTPLLWDGPFIAPVATRATSNFGTRSVFNGQPRSPHGGVDFSGSVGTPVVAPGAGRIVLAEDLFFTGNTVVIDHGFGLVSLLAHLSAMTVAQGDLVARATVVGRVGATGRVTGPHLHWTIRLNGARVDPLSLLFATQADGTEGPPVAGQARPVR
jgi:murein DD-endopeptidase MepM/ murein hydrolase activator NlpD